MISIAIPYKGKGLEQALNKFVDVEMIDNRIRDFLITISAQDKERIRTERESGRYSTNEGIEKKLQAIRDKNPLGYMLKVERDAYRHAQPARILFKELEAKINGTDVRLLGKSHYEMSTALRNHEVPMAFVGWDALYEDHIEHLIRADIREWSALNLCLRQGATDVRILGAAFNDYTGHFLMVDESVARCIASVGPTNNPSPIPELYDARGNPIRIENGDLGPIYVDHKYQKIYEAILKDRASKLKGTNDVEDTVTTKKGAGIYVVQSGSTAKRKSMHLIGFPLLVSNTVIAVNIEEFINNPALISIGKHLNPKRESSTECLADAAVWYANLVETMGRNYKFNSYYFNPLMTPNGVKWNTKRGADPGLEFNTESRMSDRPASVEPALLLK
ncbi:hypothetical protein HY486_03175 [Candidatus Woesearchaeota archaeon]|nr:hypothetical protein [Candidatus Woesearchaeota archaeon]